MKNTFCIRFYCRNATKRKDGTAPIECSIIINGGRQLFQLPKKSKPELFSKDKDAKIYCQSVENKLNQIYTNLVLNEEVITAFKLKDIYLNGNERKSYTIKDLFDDGLKLKKGENRELSTYRKYELVAERFISRTGLNENAEANNINSEHIITFRSKAEQEHSDVTVFKEMKHLKYFFTLAFNNGKIKKNPFASIKINSASHDKPYLEYEEVQKIKHLKITNDCLDRVRDLFLFLCFTGLEWADLISLKKEDVQKNGLNQLYIRKPRVKTNIEYVSILYEDAIDVWHLYDGDLPIISPQKFNLYLKTIISQAEINKNVTSLTARHTYACYLLNRKMLSIDVVSKMLGHLSTAQTKHYSKMFAQSVFLANQQSPAYAKEHRWTLEEFQEDERMGREMLELIGSLHPES